MKPLLLQPLKSLFPSPVLRIKTKTTVKLLFLFSFLGYAVAFAAANPDKFSDISRYMVRYQDAFHHLFPALTTYSDPGITLFYNLTAQFFYINDPVSLVLLNIAINSFLFALVINSLCSRLSLTTPLFIMLAALAAVYFQYGTAAQLTKQTISSSLIILSFLSSSRFSALLIFLIATAFHWTAPFVATILYITSKFSLRANFLGGLSSSGVVFLIYTTSDVIAAKFSPSSWSLANYNIEITIATFISSVLILVMRPPVNAIERKLIRAGLFFSTLFILLQGFGAGGSRLALIFYALLLPVFIFIIIKNTRLPTIPVFSLFFIPALLQKIIIITV